jgi:hypothetical protein
MWKNFLPLPGIDPRPSSPPWPVAIPAEPLLFSVNVSETFSLRPSGPSRSSYEESRYVIIRVD